MSRLSHAVTLVAHRVQWRLLVCSPVQEKPTELSAEVERLVQQGRMTAQPEAAMANLP